MASGLGDYLSQKLLNQIFAGSAYSFPATLYMGLYTVAPTATTAGTEASGGSYVRLAVTANATNFPTISGTSQTITNNTALTFVTATADWSSGSNMVALGISDAVSSGNLLMFGALTENKPVLNGDTAQFAVGALTIQMV